MQKYNVLATFMCHKTFLFTTGTHSNVGEARISESVTCLPQPVVQN